MRFGSGFPRTGTTSALRPFDPDASLTLRSDSQPVDRETGSSRRVAEEEYDSSRDDSRMAIKSGCCRSIRYASSHRLPESAGPGIDCERRCFCSTSWKHRRLDRGQRCRDFIRRNRSGGRAVLSACIASTVKKGLRIPRCAALRVRLKLSSVRCGESGFSLAAS